MIDPASDDGTDDTGADDAGAADRPVPPFVAPGPASPPPAPTNAGGAPLSRPAPIVPIARPPRPGELTPGWRFAVGAVWVGVAVALGAVWNTSVQLGLSTWWLGPRGEPQPLVVRVLPFVAPLLMVLGTINRVRRLGWFGLGASAVTAAIGVGDLGRVTGLGVVELIVAGAAAVVSIASFTGTYHRGDGYVTPGPVLAPPPAPVADDAAPV